MKFIILASGYTKPEYFYHLSETPKCLITIKGDKTILDYQYEVISQYNLPITMVIGYKGEELMAYCKKKHYNINFVWDETFREEYSNMRLVRDNLEVFKGSAVTIFSDTIFRKPMIDHLLDSPEDILKTYNLHKYTSEGMEAMVDIVVNNLHLEGFNTPMFHLIADKYPDLKLRRTFPQLWQFDVDNMDELNEIRRNFK
jgi:choline kinase